MGDCLRHFVCRQTKLIANRLIVGDPNFGSALFALIVRWLAAFGMFVKITILILLIPSCCIEMKITILILIIPPQILGRRAKFWVGDHCDDCEMACAILTVSGDVCACE